MSPENQNLFLYYLRQFEDEIKRRSDFYNQNVRMILTIPLFINAGAAIALASFFIKNNPHFTIQLAAIFFILGTSFGIITLVFEFFAAHFDWTHFNKYLFSFKTKVDGNPEKMLAELTKYFDDCSTRYKKISGTVILRIINGAASVFFCFLGIYFITSYLLSKQCLLAIGAVLFIIYCISSLVWMYFRFKL